jgi:origin recognition complex subunit 1
LLAEEGEEKAKRDDDGEDDDEEEEEEELETVFYESFKMRRKPTNYRGMKRLKVAETELQTYRVGDTVMVETDALYLMKKPPSIGVIIAMWETRRKGEENQEGASTMRIRIHWFLRPTEMASIRAKREHEEVSNLFYCILSTNMFIERNILFPVNEGCPDSQCYSLEMFCVFVAEGKGRREISCYPIEAKKCLSQEKYPFCSRQRR